MTKELVMSKFDEMITVVPRTTIFNNEQNAFNGFLRNDDARASEIYATLSEYEVKRRGDMEEDPAYKQLISYCLLENERGDILVYERLGGGGEARLHGQSSIGVGGHMNDVPEADGIENVLRINALRELEEEVGLTAEKAKDMVHVGFINDDNNEVGRVHIGVVFKIIVQSDDVEAKETDTLRIQWVDRRTITSLDDFESWSALILQSI